MIQITPQMRILVAVESVDFRRGIDGLAQLCRQELSSDPFSGAAYVFRSRSGKAIKILIYDGQGFWLCHKRLSKGKFCHWPAAGQNRGVRLESHQLAVLLCAGDPALVRGASIWRPVELPGEVR